MKLKTSLQNLLEKHQLSTTELLIWNENPGSFVGTLNDIMSYISQMVWCIHNNKDATTARMTTLIPTNNPGIQSIFDKDLHRMLCNFVHIYPRQEVEQLIKKELVASTNIEDQERHRLCEAVLAFYDDLQEFAIQSIHPHLEKKGLLVLDFDGTTVNEDLMGF